MKINEHTHLANDPSPEPYPRAPSCVHLNTVSLELDPGDGLIAFIYAGRYEMTSRHLLLSTPLSGLGMNFGGPCVRLTCMQRGWKKNWMP